MFGAFRPTNSLSGGLLWYFLPSFQLVEFFQSSLLTAISHSGKFPGDFQNSKRHDNASVCGQSIRSLQLSTERWLNRVSVRRPWRDGRKKCLQNKRCCPETNIPSLIGRRGSIERESTACSHELIRHAIGNVLMI